MSVGLSCPETVVALVVIRARSPSKLPNPAEAGVTWLEVDVAVEHQNLRGCGDLGQDRAQAGQLALEEGAGLVGRDPGDTDGRLLGGRGVRPGGESDGGDGAVLEAGGGVAEVLDIEGEDHDGSVPRSGG